MLNDIRDTLNLANVHLNLPDQPTYRMPPSPFACQRSSALESSISSIIVSQCYRYSDNRMWKAFAKRGGVYQRTSWGGLPARGPADVPDDVARCISDWMDGIKKTLKDNIRSQCDRLPSQAQPRDEQNRRNLESLINTSMAHIERSNISQAHCHLYDMVSPLITASISAHTANNGWYEMAEPAAKVAKAIVDRVHSDMTRAMNSINQSAARIDTVINSLWDRNDQLYRSSATRFVDRVAVVLDAPETRATMYNTTQSVTSVITCPILMDRPATGCIINCRCTVRHSDGTVGSQRISYEAWLNIVQSSGNRPKCPFDRSTGTLERPLEFHVLDNADVEGFENLAVTD